MFRLVMLSTVLTVAVAGASWVAPAPHAHEHYAAVPTVVAQKEIAYQKNIVEEPTITHIGNIEKKIPTGYSYQKFTQYHNKKVAQEVYAPAVKKTVVETPIEKTVYHTAPVASPVVGYAVKPDIVEAVPALPYAPLAAPVWSYAAPIAAKTVAYAHAAAPVLAYAPVFEAPLAKSVYVHAQPAVYDVPALHGKY
ncbi:cuticle protein 16.5-like [Toxorhynchites rutilus septentrionalis]|uniref:cuticle protein 16.5-like n=1 Tax=Toxorhynchites rutilus septentrionalis TaxID=329112 RepID=UPI00247A818D|nr:cuticle protein 16.5-like [Toxorhynchites rutilus septentrionalis]